MHEKCIDEAVMEGSAVEVWPVSNTATNGESVATNGELLRSCPGRVDREESVVAIPVPGRGREGKTANRRARADYNSYQRDLMRKRRAKQRAA